MAPGRRQDVQDARGGASPRRARDRSRRRVRRAARACPHGRAARWPRGPAPPPDRIPRRRRRGDGRRRDHRPAPDRGRSSTSSPTRTSPGPCARSAGRTSRSIRDAGIHVISTCNVQHLESVADAVATITGAPVNERLPDEVLAARRRGRARRHEPARPAPADAPRQRVPAGADRGRARPVLHRAEPDRAPGDRPALRRPAGRRGARRDRTRARAWPGRRSPIGSRSRSTRPRSAGPRSGAGATLASALHAPLLAIVVETPADERRAFDRERDLRENIDYAEDLGAEIVRVEASQLADGLIDVLRRRRATHLLVAHRETRAVAGFRRPSVADEVLRELPTVEVHLVAADPPSG